MKIFSKNNGEITFSDTQKLKNFSLAGVYKKKCSWKSFRQEKSDTRWKSESIERKEDTGLVTM